MQCPVCDAAEVIQIHHVLPDATEVTFSSCHRCEERWWDESGRNLPLEEVLRRARVR